MASERKRVKASVKGAAPARALARVQRALETLSAGNRILLRAAHETELLNDMCRVIVDVGGYRLAAVGYAEHDPGKSIRWLGAAGAEPGIDRVVTDHILTWGDSEGGGTATATAIRTGQAVVGRHLSTDPHYSHWRNDWIGELLKRDCSSAVVVKLFVAKRDQLKGVFWALVRAPVCLG